MEEPDPAPRQPGSCALPHAIAQSPLVDIPPASRGSLLHARCCLAHDVPPGPGLKRRGRAPSCSQMERGSPAGAKPHPAASRG